MHATNPIIAGFYPDPSVCKVGEDYYLVTSSFAYFPGIPIFHSRDLIHWTQLGHVLTEQNWLDFHGLALSDGVWAPTIREHNGVFYVVFSTSNASAGMRTFVVTATNPSGVWSTPIELDVVGFDPSLFFDDDGRAWLTACRDRVPRTPESPGLLWAREFDPVTCTVISPEIELWGGALKGAWVEAPRIFKINNEYWVLCAEGGTERGHAVTIARSEHVTGPYVGYRRNPVLTHRHLPERFPIQNVGHADLVEGPDGEIWAVALGVRPLDGHHTLGRETFLTRVELGPEGPVFAPESGRVELEFEVPWEADTSSHDIDSEALQWMTPWGPIDLSAAGQTLTIGWPDTSDLHRDAQFEYAAMRRQLHHSFEFSARLALPEGAREVSLFILQNPTRVLSAHLAGGRIVVNQSGETGPTQLASQPVNGPVTVRAGSDGYTYWIEISDDSAGLFRRLAQLPHSFFSTESAGGFVGTALGLEVKPGPQGAGRATFDQVQYHGLSHQ